MEKSEDLFGGSVVSWKHFIFLPLFWDKGCDVIQLTSLIVLFLIGLLFISEFDYFICAPRLKYRNIDYEIWIIFVGNRDSFFVLWSFVLIKKLYSFWYCAKKRDLGMQTYELLIFTFLVPFRCFSRYWAN